MKHLTFKQYVESKTKLLEAITNVPERTATYKVRKYCKLVVGENVEEQQKIELKPKQKVIVKWKYYDETPDAVSIQVEDVANVDPEDTFSTFWKGDKLIKWLNRNANEETTK